MVQQTNPEKKLNFIQFQFLKSVSKLPSLWIVTDKWASHPFKAQGRTKYCRTKLLSGKGSCSRCVRAELSLAL